MLKPKNIIIFAVAGMLLVLVYFFFIKKSGEPTGLVSTSPSASPTTATTGSPKSSNLGTQDFLAVLLSVKSIKLDNSIFSNLAFDALRDSSVILIPDGTEGRANPFAPIGTDPVTPPTNNAGNKETPTTPTIPPKPPISL